MVEALLVANDLDSDRLARAVVATMQNLPKGTFTQRIHDFIPEGQVIMHDDLIVASLVIISVIVRRIIQGRRVLRTVAAEVVHRGVIQDLLALIFRKVLYLIALQDS